MRTPFARPLTVAFSAALTIGFLFLADRPAAANGKITIVNGNDPGVGFNDPTPVAPVGGNPMTTRGAQRLFAFQHAAELWAETLEALSRLSCWPPSNRWRQRPWQRGATSVIR